MVLRSGPTHHQLCRDALAAQQGGHQGGIVQTDTLAGVDGPVHIRQIVHRDIGSQVVIVLHIFHHIGIHILHIMEVVPAFGGKLRPQGINLAAIGIPDILIGIEVGLEFVHLGCLQLAGVGNGIDIVEGVFQYRDGIDSAAAGKRQGFKAARQQRIGVEGTLRIQQLNLGFGCLAGIANLNIALLRPGGVQTGEVISGDNFSRGFGRQDGGAGIPHGFQGGLFAAGQKKCQHKRPRQEL